MTSPDHLDHVLPDCTGEWELTQPGAEVCAWRCTSCGAEHPSTAENDRAAYLEYLAGVQLRNQTRRGRFGRPPPVQRGEWMELPEPDDP